MQFAKAVSCARLVAALATMACVVVACSKDDDAASERATCDYNGKTYVQGNWPCPDSRDNSCRLICDQDGAVSFTAHTASCASGRCDGADAGAGAGD